MTRQELTQHAHEALARYDEWAKNLQRQADEGLARLAAMRQRNNTMPFQEIEDKLTELTGILQAQQVQITEIAAAQQKMASMLAAETERLTAAKRKDSARRMASPSPYDASAGGFRNRR